jgi:tRNA threonylcarbamoyl adenosine modification protein (Sua5/YciO/YrdC/YwlC family)
MEVLTKAEWKLRQNEIAQKIKSGHVFIHPTDTIYGLSCNALDKKAVDKIRRLKARPDTPFSIWAPSLKWIRENCQLSKEAEEWLAKLPGPYTIILPLKNKKALAENINPRDNSIGIRIPDHWFKEVVGAVGVPLVTTSANRAGQPFMTDLNDLDSEIEPGIEFIIYEGKKVARPSKIVNLVQKVIIER